MSGTVTVFVVPAGDAETSTQQFADPIRDSEALVGGWVSVLTSVDGCRVFSHESARVRDYPVNDRATRLVDSYHRGFADSDVLAGPVVFVGWDPDTARYVDVPDEVVARAATLFGQRG